MKIVRINELTTADLIVDAVCESSHGMCKSGNGILRRVFSLLHASPLGRLKIPPFFVFKKFRTEGGARSVQFKGIAVPGYPGVSAIEDLAAVWKTRDGKRFQNYRSLFTILNIATVSKLWVADILAGNAISIHVSEVWCDWIETRHYSPLESLPTMIIQSDVEQQPDSPLKKRILQTVWSHFDHQDKAEKRRKAFLIERLAARIFQLHDHRVLVDEITRGVADGGRDAVGRHLLGLSEDPIYAEFSPEAKCYQAGFDGKKTDRVGVKEVSGLISRIRRRQFGVLVTTSVVHKQAYQELREDGHPIIFITGRDIAETMIKAGFNTVDTAAQFLNAEFTL